MLFKAEVKVTLKKGVLDPQGAAVQGALHSLGYPNFGGVRVGKFIELWLEAASEEAAREQVETVSRKLLANPVLEHFSFTLAPAEEGPDFHPATTGASQPTSTTGANAATGASHPTATTDARRPAGDQGEVGER